MAAEIAALDKEMDKAQIELEDVEEDLRKLNEDIEKKPQRN